MNNGNNNEVCLTILLYYTKKVASVSVLLYVVEREITIITSKNPFYSRPRKTLNPSEMKMFTAKLGFGKDVLPL